MRRRVGSLCAGLLTLAPWCVQAADSDPTAPAPARVAPAAPANAMPDVPYAQMAAMMDMDDASALGGVMLDQLEWREAGGAAAADWAAEAWYGGDYNKLWARSEGDWPGGDGARGRAELLWDRIATRWWSLQGGARYDFGGGPGKGWAALGVQGLAPYWIEIEATAYVGNAGALAARFKAETDLRLAQRLVLQPELELSAYTKPDAARQQAAGLSDVDAGLRLRYEVRREFAPYLGLAWTHRPGGGTPADQWQWLLGIRAWY
jgi:copper resistance protein B